MFQRVISIELGQWKTKICEVDYRRKTPHVYQCISFDTPKNMVEDGYLKNQDALVQLLDSKIKEAGIKKTKLVFTIASTRIANKEVSIPFVKEQKILEIVKANAEEYFPVNVSDYILSYSVLERITGGDEKQLRLMVLAAPEAMVRSYYDIAEKLGCEIADIDYMFNSASQLIKKKYNTGTNLVIHINEEITFIHILDNGKLVLPKAVSFGYLTLFDTIMKSETCKAKNEEEALQFLFNNNVFHPEASSYEYVEAAIGLEQDGAEVLESKKTNDTLREELFASLNYLIINIARIMDYYSRSQGNKITSICLIGPSSRFMGLREVLFQEFGLEVKYMYTLNSVVFRRNIKVEGEDRLAYLSCIGAAIHPTEFQPKDYVARNIKNNNVHKVLFTLSAGVVICLTLIGVAYFSYQSELIKHKTLTQEITRMSEVNQIYVEHTKATERLDEINRIYMLTINPNERFIELFEELEKKLPVKAIVETLNVNTSGITLSFHADNEVTAAKTLQQLKKIPFLSEVKTNSIAISQDENEVRSVNFVVDGIYKMSMFLNYYNSDESKKDNIFGSGITEEETTEEETTEEETAEEETAEEETME